MCERWRILKVKPLWKCKRYSRLFGMKFMRMRNSKEKADGMCLSSTGTKNSIKTKNILIELKTFQESLLTTSMHWICTAETSGLVTFNVLNIRGDKMRANWNGNRGNQLSESVTAFISHNNKKSVLWEFTCQTFPKALQLIMQLAVEWCRYDVRTRKSNSLLVFPMGFYFQNKNHRSQSICDSSSWIHQC